MDFSAFLPTNYNTNVFSSLTIENENICEIQPKVELLDIFVTEFPRLTEEDMQPSKFAFAYFEESKVDFMKHQDSVQVIANELFGHTIPLSTFEQTILNSSYSKALKTTPLRSNRL